MRQLKIIVVLLIGLTGYAQESNNLSLVTSPGSYDDGFSMGIQYEYQNKTIYVGLETYYFPNLNNLDYLHGIGRVGFNVLRVGSVRTFLGARIGYILRDKRIHPLIGGEAGFDYTIPNTNVFIGLSVSRDMKADSKVWGNDSYHTVNSGLARVGFKF